MTKSKGILKRWTPDEDNFIRLNYITQTASEMSFVINRPAGSIYNRMRRLGIVIPDDIREERIARTNTNLELGRDMRFKKGMPSHNKGKKMSAELKEKMKHTFFKPGQRPANTQYDGSVRQRILNGKPYLFIRISIGNWLHLHVKLWTDANGPVPTGFNVVFKDGNTLNCVNDKIGRAHV